MTKRNDGGPAFPEIKTDWPSSNYHDTHSVGGMTLRDYFAAKAVQAQLTAFWAMEASHGWRNGEMVQITSVSYLIADAMLKAREE